MSTQFFIVHAPVITVSTREATITSPGMQFQCGTCPARVHIQHLTNLLPLLEHAREHEGGMVDTRPPLQRYGTIAVNRAGKTVFGFEAQHHDDAACRKTHDEGHCDRGAGQLAEPAPAPER